MSLPPLGQCGKGKCTFILNLKESSLQDLRKPYVLKVTSLPLSTQNSTSLKHFSLYLPKRLTYSTRVRGGKVPTGKEAKTVCHFFLISPQKVTTANFSNGLSDIGTKIKKDHINFLPFL